MDREQLIIRINGLIGEEIKHDCLDAFFRYVEIDIKDRGVGDFLIATDRFWMAAKEDPNIKQKTDWEWYDEGLRPFISELNTDCAFCYISTVVVQVKHSRRKKVVNCIKHIADNIQCLFCPLFYEAICVNHISTFRRSLVSSIRDLYTYPLHPFSIPFWEWKNAINKDQRKANAEVVSERVHYYVSKMLSSRDTSQNKDERYDLE